MEIKFNKKKTRRIVNKIEKKQEKILNLLKTNKHSQNDSNLERICKKIREDTLIKMNDDHGVQLLEMYNLAEVLMEQFLEFIDRDKELKINLISTNLDTFSNELKTKKLKELNDEIIIYKEEILKIDKEIKEINKKKFNTFNTEEKLKLNKEFDDLENLKDSFEKKIKENEKLIKNHENEPIFYMKMDGLNAASEDLENDSEKSNFIYFK